MLHCFFYYGVGDSRINRIDRASDLAERPLLVRQVRREIHLMNIPNYLCRSYCACEILLENPVTSATSTRLCVPRCGSATPNSCDPYGMYPL